MIRACASPRLQAYEYSHAAFGLSDTVYAGRPSTWRQAFTGAMSSSAPSSLFVCLIRFSRGQMTQEQHVGFEAAWYRHFVDVVWLFLFVVGLYLGALIARGSLETKGRNSTTAFPFDGTPWPLFPPWSSCGTE